jgi:hypothetical protein
MLRFGMKRWLSLAALVVGAGVVMGQGPKDIGLDVLEKPSREAPIKDVLPKLLSGDMQASVNDKDHVASLEWKARWLTYRFANAQFHTVGGPASSKTIVGLYADFDHEVQSLTGKNKDKTKECARMLGQYVIKYGKEVLATDKPLVQVNIAHVLARSAALGAPELADALVDILNDVEMKHNDAVKYWALHGLRDMLQMSGGNPQALGRERMEKIATALSDFILRKIEISPITPPEEREGMCVLRREAIRALAQIRIPALSGKLVPALTLLRVVAREDLSPPLRMDERMEAAIGVARMRPDKEKDYQPGYAVQQIALMLSDFAKFYTNNSLDRRPCRVYAAQLGEALDGLRDETKDPYVLSLFGGGKEGQKLLERIEKSPPPPAEPINADPTRLLTAAETDPPVPRLFTSIIESKVKPPKKD